LSHLLNGQTSGYVALELAKPKPKMAWTPFLIHVSHPLRKPVSCQKATDFSSPV